ncbi:putative nucleic-acid-binding protein [Moraxella osloensis]|jgi:predicted nucleic-acid-binding protein|nr:MULTISPECIES: PIN domain-containing protein [Moraxella]MDI4481191.1 type II toxin-antitoxin system VapC family toxin [Moraxella osloensis]BAV10942.1 putative nucleic-acid-binding protein [Moraxella osloensis]
MVLIDTNILLRFILQDHAELSKKANQIIADNRVTCLNSVVYEAIHVLQNVYGIDRLIVANEIQSLFIDDIIESDDKALSIKALKVFKETKMDFMDCLLIAYDILYQHQIFSFDKKVNNYLKRHHQN